MAEKMMSKIQKIFLVVTMMVLLAGVAAATEKIVQLTVPGCFA